MKIGIVGLAGSGKSTIFNALTGLRADTGAGARVKENMGVIKVPDERVDRLAELSHSKKKVLAEVTFVDVAAEPAAGGKTGVSPQVISAMQGCDALVLVLRGFENPALSEPPAPLRDLRDFQAELILSDLGPLENRLTRMAKEAGKDSEKALLQRCIGHLESGEPLASLTLSEDEQHLLAGFGNLSAKPMLFLLNQPEEAAGADVPAELAEAAGGQAIMNMSGTLEMEIAALPPEEQPEYLAAMGLQASARDRFVQGAYALLELIHFLTAGEDESRAWPIRRGTHAQGAAGKIHSDIARGFIRAEVIRYDDWIELGSEKNVKEAGKLRLEGKQYTVQDGDVINFRFNV